MTRYLALLLVTSAVASGAGAQNPFFQPSPLFNQAPPFDRIHDGDYQPAMEEGMRQQLAEVRQIAEQKTAPTFDNTIVAMERSGELLTRVARVFNAMTGANTDDTLQRVQTALAPKLAGSRASTRVGTRSGSMPSNGFWSSATIGISCGRARNSASATRRGSRY